MVRASMLKIEQRWHVRTGVASLASARSKCKENCGKDFLDHLIRNSPNRVNEHRLGAPKGSSRLAIV
jgi:hypothetical protein